MLGTQDTVGADPMLGSTWTTVAVAAVPRPAPSEKSFKSVRRGRGLTRRFQRFQCHLQDLQQPAPAATGSTPADSLKSGKPWPARFHRFQRNSHCRFTLSTAGLYDLYTRYGQSVDKKGLQRSVRNYPQVPPQPQGPLYRGFQANKSLLNHKDRLFLHEIWPYHHHHALDLYPDLEAWQGPNPPGINPVDSRVSRHCRSIVEPYPNRRDFRFPGSAPSICGFTRTTRPRHDRNCVGSRPRGE